MQYYFLKDLAFSATEDTFRLSAEKIEQKIVTFDKTNVNLMKALDHSLELKEFPKATLSKKSLKFLAIVLKNKPYYNKTIPTNLLI